MEVRGVWRRCETHIGLQLRHTPRTSTCHRFPGIAVFRENQQFFEQIPKMSEYLVNGEQTRAREPIPVTVVSAPRHFRCRSLFTCSRPVHSICMGVAPVVTTPI